MRIVWKVKSLNPEAARFVDRILVLDTHELDVVTRNAVELTVQRHELPNQRDILRFRSLFRELQAGESVSDSGAMCIIPVLDYFEGPDGREVTGLELGRILTGRDGVEVLRSFPTDEDVDQWFRQHAPYAHGAVDLNAIEIHQIEYFLRDAETLGNSELHNEGPGTLYEGPVLRHETALSANDIKAISTDFRRLILQEDLGNVWRVANIFIRTVKEHEFGRWVKFRKRELDRLLKSIPDPHIADIKPTFTIKDLIDVNLYSRYSHQPCEERQREFYDYLQQLNGSDDLMRWMYLSALWECGEIIAGISRAIRIWFSDYCNAKGLQAARIIDDISAV